MTEVEIFKALSDPTRLKILECIKTNEKCICDVIPYTGKSQPCVSQHLKIMKNARIIDMNKNGTKVMIKASNPKIFDLIKQAKNLK